MSRNTAADIPWDYLGNAVGHGVAMDSMEEMARRLRSGEERTPSILYLQHEGVVTVGRETVSEHLAHLDPAVPRVAVARGGQATYHGPGILVGYLVIDLKERANRETPDLHSYIRAVEQGLMDYVEETYGLACVRRRGFTGVWTPGGGYESTGAIRKIAAIGIGCRRWVTTHGFALNLHPDLGVFRSFVPCGITDAKTSSIREELELAGLKYDAVPMKEVASRVHPYLVHALQDAGWLRVESAPARIEIQPQ